MDPRETMYKRHKCGFMQTINRTVGKKSYKTLQRCGKCYICRSTDAMATVGAGQAELYSPVHAEARNPLSNHFLTLTYNDDHLPMTVPVPHVFGFNTSPDGELTRYRGPYVGGYHRIGIEPDTDRPCYVTRDDDGARVYLDLLTDDENAKEHERYCEKVLNWDDDKIGQWLSGKYAPVPTLSRDDWRGFKTRVTRAFNYRGLPSPRHLVAGEYGEERGRPHLHAVFYGVRLDNLHLLYEAWAPFGDLKGHIDPPLLQALTDLRHPSVPRTANAFDYCLKDQTKSIRDLGFNPGLHSREIIRPQGSKRPALGANFYPYWFEQRVLKAAALTDCETTGLPESERLAFRLVAIRQNWNLMYVPVMGHAKAYPTPDHFKERAKSELNYTERQWEESNHIMCSMEKDIADAASTPVNVGGMAEEYEAHQKLLKDRTSQRIEDKKRRIERKIEERNNRRGRRHRNNASL